MELKEPVTMEDIQNSLLRRKWEREVDDAANCSFADLNRPLNGDFKSGKTMPHVVVFEEPGDLVFGVASGEREDDE